MNIFFDARWTRFSTHDGISRYGASLVSALAKLHPVTMLIYDKRQLALLPPNVPYIVVNNPLSWRELFIARTLNRHGADVVFTPLQVMGFWGRRYKLILTLQDTFYYEDPTPPAFLPLPVRIAWRLFYSATWPQRWLLKHADYITTVSKTSKQLIEAMRLTDKEIGVVYNAPFVKAPKPQPLKTTKKEIVYMGSFMPYKNVEFLLKAMSFLPDFRLHLLSPIQADRKSELQKLTQDKEQVIFHNGTPEEEYHELLRSTWALVSASKAEGFGLPLIEAASLRVPVICSDLPIFHEVMGDSAQYFDLNSPEDFAKAVRNLDDSALRKHYIEKAQNQALQFTWEKSAAALLDIIKKVTVQKR